MDSFTPLAKLELRKKIQMLEENQAHLKHEVSQLTRLRRITRSCGGAGQLPSSYKLSDWQYQNILQSVGQSVHAIDSNDRIIYWNRSAENLFGYSAEEALGQVSIKLVVDSPDYDAAHDVVHRVNLGERWTGMFPVKKKSRERFTIIVTNNPLFDDAGILIGAVCTCMDAQQFYDMRVPMSAEKQPQKDLSFSSLGASVATKLVSKVTNKVKSRIQSREENMDPEGGIRDSHHSVFSYCRTSTPTGDIPPSTPFGVFNRNVRSLQEYLPKGYHGHGKE